MFKMYYLIRYNCKNCNTNQIFDKFIKKIKITCRDLKYSPWDKSPRRGNSSPVDMPRKILKKSLKKKIFISHKRLKNIFWFVHDSASCPVNCPESEISTNQYWFVLNQYKSEYFSKSLLWTILCYSIYRYIFFLLLTDLNCQAII